MDTRPTGQVRRAAASWLEFEAPGRPTEIRFDQAAVDDVGAVDVIEGAF